VILGLAIFIQLTCDGQTHDDSIYRASYVSAVKMQDQPRIQMPSKMIKVIKIGGSTTEKNWECRRRVHVYGRWGWAPLLVWQPHCSCNFCLWGSIQPTCSLVQHWKRNQNAPKQCISTPKYRQIFWEKGTAWIIFSGKGYTPHYALPLVTFSNLTWPLAPFW